MIINFILIIINYLHLQFSSYILIVKYSQGT